VKYCLGCDAGKYQEAKGASSCDDCPVGKYNVQFRAAKAEACVPCKRGTFTSQAGAYTQAQCHICPAKTQILVPNNSTTCPWNFEIGFGQAVKDCKCAPQINGQQYLKSTDGSGKETCQDCPKDMICPGDDFAFPKKGFWRKNKTGVNSNIVFSCKPSKACLGAIKENCSHDHCAAGYDSSSLACAGCDKGHTKIMRSGECQACLGPDYVALVLVLAGMFLVLGYIYRKAGQTVNLEPGQDASAYNMGTFSRSPSS
jgi:hypothetical protein